MRSSWNWKIYLDLLECIIVSAKDTQMTQKKIEITFRKVIKRKKERIESPNAGAEKDTPKMCRMEWRR